MTQTQMHSTSNDSSHPMDDRFMPFEKLIAQAAEEMLKPVPAVHFMDFPRFSKSIGGFRPREFTILCGSTGSGKTTLLANLSLDLMKQHIPQLVLSVETGHTDFIRRVMSSLAAKNLNTGEVISPALVGDTFIRNKLHLIKSGSHLSLYDNRVTVEQLMDDIREAHKSFGAKVVLVDNLNFFMEVTTNANAVIEMDRVIHSLIIFCKQVDVHIVMVMHPRKTYSGRVQSEFDIKGSSTSVQEAHNVIVLNRPHRDLISNGAADKDDRELSFLKIRRLGANMGKSIIFRAEDSVKYIEKAGCEFKKYDER